MLPFSDFTLTPFNISTFFSLFVVLFLISLQVSRFVIFPIIFFIGFVIWVISSNSGYQDENTVDYFVIVTAFIVAFASGIWAMIATAIAIFASEKFNFHFKKTVSLILGLLPPVALIAFALVQQ